MPSRAVLRAGIVGALFALLALWTVAFAGPYALRLMALAGVSALMVLGYQLVFGFGGALSLAQGAFFGLGAYTAALVALKLGWPFEARLALAILVPALLAWPIALIVRRLDSHYFALATLGIAQILLLLAIGWQDLTGGANGLAGISSLPRGLPTVALVWALVAIVAMLAWVVLRGRWSARLALLRAEPIAAAASGIDAGRVRLLLLVASAAAAGGAGALQVHILGLVSPDVLGFHVMVGCLAMAVVGGSTSLAGGILGAVLLTMLPEWFRPLEGHAVVAYGAALLLAILVAPTGLTGLLDRAIARFVPATKPDSPEPATLSPAAAPRPLVARGLARSFGGVAALDGVDLDLEPGEIVGLVGPNGSGKTTLVNLIAGADRADRGTVVLGNVNLTDLPAVQRARLGLARSFQATALAEDVTPLDAVAAAFWRVSGSVARAQARTLLAQVGIPEAVMARPAGLLDHGQRRRVELARVLALDPAVLLLDEPTAGLTAKERSALADLLRLLAGEGRAILVVEHALDFLWPIAGRVICLEAGRVAAAGEPSVLAADPDLARRFFGGAA